MWHKNRLMEGRRLVRDSKGLEGDRCTGGWKMTCLEGLRQEWRQHSVQEGEGKKADCNDTKRSSREQVGGRERG